MFLRPTLFPPFLTTSVFYPCFHLKMGVPAVPRSTEFLSRKSSPPPSFFPPPLLSPNARSANFSPFFSPFRDFLYQKRSRTPPPQFSWRVRCTRYLRMISLAFFSPPVFFFFFTYFIIPDTKMYPRHLWIRFALVLFERDLPQFVSPSYRLVTFFSRPVWSYLRTTRKSFSS